MQTIKGEKGKKKRQTALLLFGHIALRNSTLGARPGGKSMGGAAGIFEEKEWGAPFFGRKAGPKMRRNCCGFLKAINLSRTKMDNFELTLESLFLGGLGQFN